MENTTKKNTKLFDIEADERLVRPKFTPPVSYEDACTKANEILKEMSLDEKIDYIAGFNFFFIRGNEKHNLPNLYLTDATLGVHLRKELDEQLEKSTSFPCPIALTSTWNTQLSYKYAQAIGEECRAGGIAVLLGPGMNMYRISQNGRNFEYFGEDPFLAARLIEQYVVGMQSTGTIATLKHFMCNNTDHYRRTSNSVVDERTMHEIYLPAFKAGIDAGAMAVMTGYNLVCGEWAGQSKYVITNILRNQLGYKWLVMSDWWSVWDPEKAIKSGLDVEMPGHGMTNKDDFTQFNNPFLRSNAKRLVEEGKVEEKDIDRMARNVLATSIAMGLDTRPVKDQSYVKTIPAHKDIALQTAREGIVLLKNEKDILPVTQHAKASILLTGKYLNKNAQGGGSSVVEGYDNITIQEAFEKEFGEAVIAKEKPSLSEIKSAKYVIYSTGTDDSEAWDSPFELPDDMNNEIINICSANDNTIVIMQTGRGVEMTPWIDTVKALIYAWYPGQTGNIALAEIISGKTNPSGKLPITIEKKFNDSLGYNYMENNRNLYVSWDEDLRLDLPIHNIEYSEGIFVGYRWYEEKNIEPLFHFGFGLSYTNYQYSDLRVSKDTIAAHQHLTVCFKVKNTGKVAGSEICQLYIKDNKASVPRPQKELKGFSKIHLNPNEEKEVEITLIPKDFSFYDEHNSQWKIENGTFTIMVGGASNAIALKTDITIK